MIKPVFVLVQGAFHTVKSWSGCQKRLASRGIQSRLISESAPGLVQRSLYAYAESIRYVFDSCEDGYVLLATSFGATPALMAMDRAKSAAVAVRLFDGLLLEHHESVYDRCSPIERRLLDHLIAVSGSTATLDVPARQLLGDTRLGFTYASALCPQPVQSFLEAPGIELIRRWPCDIAYVTSRETRYSQVERALLASRDSHHLGWTTCSSDLPHEAPLTAPDALVDLITDTL